MIPSPYYIPPQDGAGEEEKDEELDYHPMYPAVSQVQRHSPYIVCEDEGAGEQKSSPSARNDFGEERWRGDQREGDGWTIPSSQHPLQLPPQEGKGQGNDITGPRGECKKEVEESDDYIEDLLHDATIPLPTEIPVKTENERVMTEEEEKNSSAFDSAMNSTQSPLSPATVRCMGSRAVWDEVGITDAMRASAASSLSSLHFNNNDKAIGLQDCAHDTEGTVICATLYAMDCSEEALTAAKQPLMYLCYHCTRFHSLSSLTSRAFSFFLSFFSVISLASSPD